MSQFDPGDTAPSAIPPMLLGVARNLASTVAGGLVTHGVIADDQQQAVVGIIVAILAVAFSIYQKHHVKKNLQAAIDAPAGSAS